jgi:hypothetical protein
MGTRRSICLLPKSTEDESMSRETLLATVRAAANPELAANAANQTQEHEMSTTTDKPATITSLAALQAAYPALCSDLQASARTEGATAERARILGIEANALPGHEKLIADMKVDGSVTPDQAAGRILAAERALRTSGAQAIVDVEKVTNVVAAAPLATATPPAKAVAQTAEGWKGEFAASATLQSEFASAEDYAAFKAAEVGGKVRFLRKA